MVLVARNAKLGGQRHGALRGPRVGRQRVQVAGQATGRAHGIARLSNRTIAPLHRRLGSAHLPNGRRWGGHVLYFNQLHSYPGANVSIEMGAVPPDSRPVSGWQPRPLPRPASRPASSGSMCRTTHRADGFGPAKKRRTVQFGGPCRFAAASSERRSAFSVLTRFTCSPAVRLFEAICWKIAASFAGSSCAAAARRQRQRRWPGRERASPS